MRVGSSVGTASPRGRLEQERAEPLLGAGDDEHPVGGVPVEHDRLLTREHPVGALAPGPGAHAVDGSPWPCSSSATVPRIAPDASCASRSASPSRRAASVANTADEKNGPGSGSRPISSSTTTMSTSPRPRPPCVLGHEQAGPAELGELVPDLVGEAALVVDHRPHVGAGRLAREERAHRLAQRVLLVAEREVHGNAASRET